MFIIEELINSYKGNRKSVLEIEIGLLMNCSILLWYMIYIVFCFCRCCLKFLVVF